MKKIIAADLIIIVLVYFYYPVFDSEKISYFIIFSCFTVLCFSVAKIYSPGDNENYASVEKEMDKRHNDDGIFRYKQNGFYVKQENDTEWIEWNDIVSVYSFSLSIFIDTRQKGIEIITDKKRYEFIYENVTGLEKLTDQLATHLPDWKPNSPTIQNNAGTEKTMLYQRKDMNYKNQENVCHYSSKKQN